jgi:hypothetical protein
MSGVHVALAEIEKALVGGGLQGLHVAEEDADERFVARVVQAAQQSDLDEKRRDLYAQIGSALRGIQNLTGRSSYDALHMVGCPEEEFDVALALTTPTQKLKWIASTLIAFRDACEVLRDLGVGRDDAWGVVTEPPTREAILAFQEATPGQRAAEAVALVIQHPLVDESPLQLR